MPFGEVDDIGTPFSGFEGPEKRLEIAFSRPLRDSQGLRSLTRAQVDQICGLVNCAVLNTTSNDFVDEFVLSESSLFLFSDRMVLKTCGTTTLLMCLPLVLKFSSQLGMKPEYVSYSRRNYFFPTQQKFPHCSFENEVDVLNTHFKHGAAYILGPITGAHWHLYVADMREPSQQHDETDGLTHLGSSQHSLEIMMTDLDPKKMKQFYRRPGIHHTVQRKQITESSGISKLMPGSNIDDYLFDPCGYSMNGIRGADFNTIHVTPEPECSFVSYETNCNVESYPSLVAEICDIFGPRELTVAIVADQDSQPSSSVVQKLVKRLKLSHKMKDSSSVVLSEMTAATVINFSAIV